MRRVAAPRAARRPLAAALLIGVVLAARAVPRAAGVDRIIWYLGLAATGGIVVLTGAPLPISAARDTQLMSGRTVTRYSFGPRSARGSSGAG